MKKIFVVLAMAASIQVASAQQQVKSFAAAKSAVEASMKAANDAKKGVKAATWLKLGQNLLEAYYAPQGNAWVGASEQDIALVMPGEKARSEEQVTVGGQPMIKKVYDTKNYYFNGNGQLAIIETTKPVVENALDKACDAFRKASELDVKGQKTKDILAGMKTVVEKYSDEAYNAYNFGKLDVASAMFEKAANASSFKGLQLDTNAIYNTAYTAYALGDYDRAKDWFQRSIGVGYDGENGEAYAKLADIAEKAGDAEGSKNILEKAFTKYPQSQSILIGLINYYVTKNEDTGRLFQLLDGAKKNEPNNASLYYVEGNIHNQLGETEAAIASYDKCAEVNPSYEYGYIGKGILYYNKAVEIQEMANSENDDAKYDALVKEFESTLKSCVEPFEKAFELTQTEDVKASVAEYLKNACFRFREDETYAAKYQKYADASAKK